MATLLHMTYDTVQAAIQKSGNQREELASQLQKINNAVESMSASFQGKAGKSCLNYWQSTGLKHSQNIIQQLEVLDQKLKEISELIGQNDDECASLFVIQG